MDSKEQKRAIKGLLESIDRRVIAFYPLLARDLEGINAAIFLWQIIHWSPHGSKGNGVIYKTDREIFKETTLTSKQQNLIRKNLVRLGILKIWPEQVRGVVVLHYQVQWVILRKRLEAHSQTSVRSISEMTSEITSKDAFPSGKGNGPIPIKRKRTYINDTTERIYNAFKKLCLRDLGCEPIDGVRKHRAITFATNTGGLTEVQILDLFDEWFGMRKPDDQTISITAALSGNSIDGYKARNHIRPVNKSLKISPGHDILNI